MQAVRFPEKWDVSLLQSSPPKPCIGDEAVIAEALDNPMAGPRLEDLASHNPKTIIVVSDLSRAWQRPSVFMPMVLDRLLFGGIREERITILVAAGTHAPHTDQQHRALLGDAVCDRFRVISHDCRNEDDLLQVGLSPAGHPVLVNRAVVEAELLVVTGAVTFHGLAGFSGGPKSIVPGVAGYSTIQANHRICLDENGRLKEEIHHGRIAGNPLAEDMAGAAGLIRIDFLLNVVVGYGGRFLAAVSGEPAKAHRRCCEQARSFFEVPLTRRAQLVVANVGGHPRDADWFQSVKALGQAAEAVAEGGTLVLLSRCTNGFGPPELLEWFGLGSRECIVERLVENFTITGFVALKVHEIAHRHRLILVSDMAPEMVGLCPVESATSVEEALAMAGGREVHGKRVIWMPSAATTVPVVA